MDKADCRIKTKALIFDAMLTVVGRIENLLNSGALDLESFEDGYRLPRMLMSDALKFASQMYLPYNKQDQAMVKNMEKF